MLLTITQFKVDTLHSFSLNLYLSSSGTVVWWRQKSPMCSLVAAWPCSGNTTPQPSMVDGGFTRLCSNVNFIVIKKQDPKSDSVGLLYLQAAHPQSESITDQKYLKKKFQKVPKSKTWICYAPSTIYIVSALYLQLPMWIYMVLGIITHLERIYSIEECM